MPPTDPPVDVEPPSGARPAGDNPTTMSGSPKRTIGARAGLRAACGNARDRARDQGAVRLGVLGRRPPVQVPLLHGHDRAAHERTALPAGACRSWTRATSRRGAPVTNIRSSRCTRCAWRRSRPATRTREFFYAERDPRVDRGVLDRAPALHHGRDPSVVLRPRAHARALRHEQLGPDRGGPGHRRNYSRTSDDATYGPASCSASARRPSCTPRCW